MDLNLNQEELAFRDELRSWLAANVPADWDERREDSMQQRFDYLKRWQRKLYDGGWARRYRPSHGHTHVRRHEKRGRVLFLNPGCVTRANQGAPPSVAWLEVGDGKLNWKLVPLR